MGQFWFCCKIEVSKIMCFMKKLLFFAIMLCISMSAFCQNAHLSFKGVPIDGTLTEYVNKMKAAGFTHLGTEDGIALIQGDFAGYKNCTIGVQTLKPRNLVHEITVVFPSQEKWQNLENDYIKIKEMLTTKYGAPSKSKEEFVKTPVYMDLDKDDDKMAELRDDRCEYYSVFTLENGRISLQLRYTGYPYFAHIQLWYTDKANESVIEADAMNDL